MTPTLHGGCLPGSRCHGLRSIDPRATLNSPLWDSICPYAPRRPPGRDQHPKPVPSPPSLMGCALQPPDIDRQGGPTLATIPSAILGQVPGPFSPSSNLQASPPQSFSRGHLRSCPRSEACTWPEPLWTYNHRALGEAPRRSTPAAAAGSQAQLGRMESSDDNRESPNLTQAGSRSCHRSLPG